MSLVIDGWIVVDNGGLGRNVWGERTCLGDVCSLAEAQRGYDESFLEPATLALREEFAHGAWVGRFAMNDRAGAGRWRWSRHRNPAGVLLRGCPSLPAFRRAVMARFLLELPRPVLLPPPPEDRLCPHRGSACPIPGFCAPGTGALLEVQVLP